MCLCNRKHKECGFTVSIYTKISLPCNNPRQMWTAFYQKCRWVSRIYKTRLSTFVKGRTRPASLFEDPRYRVRRPSKRLLVFLSFFPRGKVCASMSNLLLSRHSLSSTLSIFLYGPSQIKAIAKRCGFCCIHNI
jgi:hypothetical protein